MRSPPDLAERVARIEERMTTREEIDALRAELRRHEASARWHRGVLSTAALVFLALLFVFTG